MKALKRFFMITALSLVTIAAMADWTYGTATFKGNQPSKGMTIGGVSVWYNGTLKQTHTMGGVDYWECSGDICVAYPRNYNGPKLSFKSTGGTVQIKYLR